MEARPVVSRARGAVIGLGSALPFAVVAYVALGTIGTWACLVSGTISGATFGRRVAAKPTLARLSGAPGLSVLIGIVVTLLWAVPASRPESWSSPSSVVVIFVVGIAVYSIPAYFLLAVPAFALGVWIARRAAR